jgi:hypothetical protein
MRLYMHILRLTNCLATNARTNNSIDFMYQCNLRTKCELLLQLLVQTKIPPKICLIFLQHCVDSDSTKLHCNALSTPKSSLPEKAHHVTNISAISHCRHHPVSLGMLLVALPIDRFLISRTPLFAPRTLSPAPSVVAFHIPIEKLGYCHLSHSPYRRVQH